jgi:uncharacterized protein DUF4386
MGESNEPNYPSKHRSRNIIATSGADRGFRHPNLGVRSAICRVLSLPATIYSRRYRSDDSKHSVQRGSLSRRDVFYLVNAIGDILVAWALYIFLAPVNRSAALLAAWFRLIYTAIFIVAFLKLATVFRLLNTPDNMTVLGPDQFHVQVELLLRSFRYEWSFGLVFFGVHLGLLGYLVYRSGYIPKILGLLLVIAGVGNSVQALSPYLYPNADLGFIMITFFGELTFMLWLLVGGWRIKEPTA